MKPEDYKKALSAVALGEEEEERLAAAVVKKLEKKRQRKRIVRRVLVPVFSAAALCVVAVPLAIAWAPAGAPAGSEPDHSDPPFSEEDPPSGEDPSETPEETGAFSCVYEAGGVRLCLNFDLNEIK